MLKADIGTVERPLSGKEPMDVVEGVLVDLKASGGGLCFYRSLFWEFQGGQWRARAQENVVAFLTKWMQGRVYECADGGTKPLVVKKALVEDVVFCLRAVVMCDFVGLPNEAGFDTEFDIPFLDHVATVKGGRLQTRTRQRSYFDSYVLPVGIQPDAECPRWMQALEEWSGGDEAWKELLKRWFGYCLIGNRGYERWMLLHGKTRGGKGTIVKVLHMLLGDEAFVSLKMSQLCRQFGMDAALNARVMNVPEVSDLDKQQGQEAAGVMKTLIGQDPINVDVKYQSALRNVTLGVNLMMSGNQIPKLPNNGEGLSGKMLLLPFEESFLDREQFDLVKELEGELAGIAWWAVEGVLALEAEGDPGKKWPVPVRAVDHVARYHVVNNPLDGFLEARFVRVEDGFVPSRMIQKEWGAFVRQNKIREHIPSNQLIHKLETESTWPIHRGRLGSGGVRGLGGLRLRKVIDDEV